MRYILCLVSILFLSACDQGTPTSTPSDNSQAVDSSTFFTADLSKAVAVARVQTGYSTDGDFKENDLLGIDSLGRLKRIFNAHVAIFKIEKTTNFLIVDGVFTPEMAPLSSLNTTPQPQKDTCYLLAIPLATKGNSKDLICLYHAPPGTAEVIGDFDPTNSALEPESMHYGVAVRGKDVYFTVCPEQHGICNGQLYKWTEGMSAPTSLFTMPSSVAGCSGACSGLDDVFLDPNSNNICVLNAGPGHLYCGTDNGLFQISLTGAAWYDTRVLGKWILTMNQKIDITTTVTAMNAATVAVNRVVSGPHSDIVSGLPEEANDIATDGANGLINRSFSGSLSHTDSSGNTTIMTAISAGFQQVIRVGNFVWTWSVPWATNDQWDYAESIICGSISQCGSSYGGPPTTGQTLNRIALTNPGTIDNVGDGNNGGNYLSNVGMDYITNLSLNLDSTLTVYGIKNGLPARARIDGAGNIMTNTPEDVPLDQILSLQ